MSVPPLDVAKAWPSLELEHGRQLFRAQFSFDGRWIAAGGQDKLVHLWELEKDGKKALKGHDTWVSSLVFHPKEKKLFTADYLGVIHCWGYEKGDKPLWTIAEADRDNVRALVVTADGKHLISAGDDAVIKVWKTSDGKQVTKLKGHEECIFSLALSPGWQASRQRRPVRLRSSMEHWRSGRRCANWTPNYCILERKTSSPT